MANIQGMFHKFVHRTCHRTNDKLMNRLKNAHVQQIQSQVTILDHPYVKLMNEKLEKICSLIGKQCQVVGQHRARRTIQILTLYRNLYGNHLGPSREMLKKLADILRLKNANGKRLFLLTAVLFDWNKERITDDIFSRTKNDLKCFIESHAKSASKKLEDPNGEVWEKVLDTETFKLWRCPVPGSSLYKYKVYGTYTDLPASVFYEVQMDINYRKRWDKHVIKLEKVEHDEKTGTELIYWATQFPLNFMSYRDYLYVRRCEVDLKRNVMIISAKGVQHPKYPVSDEFVRVDPYISNMLIKPHTSFERKGFDYVMTYYDDPKLYGVPSWAINKMTVSSLPSFLNTIHEAAVKLQHSKSQGGETTGNNNENNNNNNNNNNSLSMSTRLLNMGTVGYQYMETKSETNQS